MNVNDEDIETQVARGAAWLDERKPGWENLVDIDKLVMSDSDNCIAGQVFRDEAAEHPDWHVTDGYDYVYDLMGGEELVSHAFVFEGREQWIAQVEARRELVS